MLHDHVTRGSAPHTPLGIARLRIHPLCACLPSSNLTTPRRYHSLHGYHSEPDPLTSPCNISPSKHHSLLTLRGHNGLFGPRLRVPVHNMSGSCLGVKWGAASVMIMTAAAVIIFGHVSSMSGVLLNVYIGAYVAWVISTCVLVSFNLELSHASSKSIMHCIYYLFWVGLTFWIFHRGFGVPSSHLPYYLPMCTNIGILLGAGANETWSAHLKDGLPRTFGNGFRCFKRYTTTIITWTQDWWAEFRRSAAVAIAPVWLGPRSSRL